MHQYNLLATVDISRVADTFARNQLPNIVLVGREILLLERMRRSEKDATLSKKMISLHASHLNLDQLQYRLSLQVFQDFRMISSYDESKFQLEYTISKEVYDYGYKRLEGIASARELRLVDYVARSMKKPQDMSELDEIIDTFDKEFRAGLKAFVIETVMSPIFAKKEEYAVSSRIFREKKIFKEAMDILDANEVGTIISTLQNNPGLPAQETAKRLNLKPSDLDLLSKSGVIDPLNLTISGNTKTYLFGADLLCEKTNQDHLDLVKMTLANFRYAEHYSMIARLRSLEKFFSYLLDHGYAGRATPILTDYTNLETTGVLRVQKLSDGKGRFWLLKRDVIQDALDVIEGYTPFHIGPREEGLSRLDDVITSRIAIKVKERDTQKRVADAKREIEEGMV